MNFIILKTKPLSGALTTSWKHGGWSACHCLLAMNECQRSLREEDPGVLDNVVNIPAQNYTTFITPSNYKKPTSK